MGPRGLEGRQGPPGPAGPPAYIAAGDFSVEDSAVAPLDPSLARVSIGGATFGLAGLSRIGLDIPIVEAQFGFDTRWKQWTYAGQPVVRPVTLQRMSHIGMGNPDEIAHWWDDVKRGNITSRDVSIQAEDPFTGNPTFEVRLEACVPTAAAEGFVQQQFAELTVVCERLEILHLQVPAKSGGELQISLPAFGAPPAFLAGVLGGVEAVELIPSFDPGQPPGTGQHFVTPVLLQQVIPQQPVLEWIRDVLRRFDRIDVDLARIEFNGAVTPMLRWQESLLTRVTLFNPLGAVQDNGGRIPIRLDLLMQPTEVIPD